MTDAPGLTLATHAMGTRFELVLCGENETHLRAIGEEVIAEIQRWHRKLNAFAPDSDITRINTLASLRPVRVDTELCDLLVQCLDLNKRTQGAFDITIAPLMRTHGFRGAACAGASAPLPFGRVAAKQGIAGLELDRDKRTISFTHPGIELDLGGIAKGFVLDRAREILTEHGIQRALVHGGTSTLIALGAWRVGIAGVVRTAQTGAQPKGVVREDAREAAASLSSRGRLPSVGVPATPPEWTVTLTNSALSVSAVHGRVVEGRGHVMDPRTGSPAAVAAVAAAICDRATDADAWSTALIVLKHQPPETESALSSLMALEWGDGVTWTRRGFQSHLFQQT